jgi:hypothetical protein
VSLWRLKRFDSKVSFPFSPGFSPVQEQLQHRETVSTVFVISLRETVKTVAL